MSTHNFLAIDFGAESGRVMLGTLSPDKITLTELHRFPNLSIRTPTADGRSTLHWDVLRLWHEVQTGIAKATAAHTISGIAVDTWGVDFALLDAHGQLLANPVCYRDSRTDGLPEKVFAKLPQSKIYSITGIQTMPLNTLFQLASLSFSNSPQLHAAKSLLFMPDLIAYWLSGKQGNEYTIASTSQMLDAQTRTWSPEILSTLGLAPELFPPLIHPAQKNSLLGTVQKSIGQSLNATGIPVISVGSHDTASAVAAVPATSGDDWLYLSSGTWSLLGAEVDHPVLSEKAAHYNVTNEGGVGGKIRLLKNIAGLWLLQECKRSWAAAGTDLDYATIVQLAESSQPHLALLDLDDPAFSTPGDMPQKIVAHLQRYNLPTPSTPGQFARIIFESLAHTYAKVAKILEELTGKKFTRLHIVGGGSQNNLLNQLAANATKMTVIAGPVEATALGNIAAQALSTGHLGSISHARTLIAQSFNVKTFTPQK